MRSRLVLKWENKHKINSHEMILIFMIISKGIFKTEKDMTLSMNYLKTLEEAKNFLVCCERKNFKHKKKR